MAVPVVSASNTGSAVGSSVTLTTPAGSEGDLLLAIIACFDLNTITNDSGEFTELTAGDQITWDVGVDEGTMAVFYLARPASPESTYDFESAGGDDVVGILYNITGADITDPEDGFANNELQNTNTPAFDSFSTTATNTLIFAACGWENDASNTHTKPSAYTAQIEIKTTGAASVGLAVSTLNKTSAGSVSSTTSSMDGSAPLGTRHFAIQETQVPDTILTPNPAVITMAGQAPTVLYTANPNPAVITMAGQAPTVLYTAKPNPGLITMAASAFAPTVKYDTNPDPAVLTMTAPSVTMDTGGSPVTVTPDPAVITMAGAAPTVLYTATPDQAVITMTGAAPTVLYTATPNPAVITMAASAFAPTVLYTATPNPAVITMAASAFAPTLIYGTVLTPDALALLLTAPSVTVDTGGAAPVEVTPVAADVQPGDNAVLMRTTASATFNSAGTPVYVTMGNKFAPAQSDLNEAIGAAVGIFVNSPQGTDQWSAAQVGGDVDLGVDLVPGEVYCVSDTPGNLKPAALLTTGEWVTVLGVATAVRRLTLNVVRSGVQKP
jgi:hypothetical protein